MTVQPRAGMTVGPVRNVDAARRRAGRIRIKARTITEQYADLLSLVDEAERNEDHLALGYPSWTAYVAYLFGGEPLRLPRDARIPMSNMLSEQGMSTRAIGSVLGVTHETVAQDIKSPVRNLTPESPAERIDRETGEVLPLTQVGSAEQIDSLTGEVIESGTSPQARRAPWPERHDEPAAEQRVTGLDGKMYTRTEPRRPSTDRRPPLRDGFRDAALDLGKLVARFERLTADDRLPRNKSEVARYANDLTRAIDALQRVVEQLS